VTFEASGTMDSILPKGSDIYYKWRARSASETWVFMRVKPGEILKSLLRSMVA